MQPHRRVVDAMPLEVRGERGDVARRRHDVVRVGIFRDRLDGGARSDAAQVIKPAQRRPRRRARDADEDRLRVAARRVEPRVQHEGQVPAELGHDAPAVRAQLLREARAAARHVRVPLGEAREDRPNIQQRRGARGDVVHARADVGPVVARDDQRGRGAGVAQGPQPLHRRVLHAARRHVRDRVEARLLEHGAGRLDGREVLVLGVDEVHEDRARGARSCFCQFRVACCLPWSDLDRCVPAELPQALTGRREGSYSTYRNERCSAAHEGQGWHCCCSYAALCSQLSLSGSAVIDAQTASIVE